MSLQPDEIAATDAALMSMAAVQKRLGLGSASVRLLIKNGTLRATHIPALTRGGHPLVRVLVADVERIVRAAELSNDGL